VQAEVPVRVLQAVRTVRVLVLQWLAAVEALSENRLPVQGYAFLSLLPAKLFLVC